MTSRNGRPCNDGYFALCEIQEMRFCPELAYNFTIVFANVCVFEEPESDLDRFKSYIKSKGYDINF